ncbi:MAG: oligosaccharide flippase family protein [Clostridiaceae bacterium]|nr:oligosaccharide flippase family protein [Clostridiaceae bacterium]
MKPLAGMKNFVWISLGSASNTLTSLFFLMIVTRTLGVNDAGIFAIAFTTAQILLTVGLYGIRNYQVTDLKDQFSSGIYIALRVMTSVMMVVIGLIFCILSRYDLLKSQIVLILILYKMSEAISDVYYGILQKKNKLYIVGFSMTLRSVLSLIFFFIYLAYVPQANLLTACLGLMVTGYLPIILVDIPCAGRIEKTRPVFDKTEIGRLLSLCFPIFVVSFLSIIVVNIPKYIIDSSLSEEVQTIYNIIVMPGTSIALFSQIIVQSLLVRMAESINRQSKTDFKKLIGSILLLVVLFTALFTVFCGFYGETLLYFLYKIDVAAYIPYLIVIVAGAMFSSIANVFSVVLTALRKMNIQMYVYLICLALSFPICWLLIPQYSIAGASISYLLIMFIQFALCSAACYTLYRKMIKNSGEPVS